MNALRKPLSPIATLLILLVALAALGGGFYYWWNFMGKESNRSFPEIMAEYQKAGIGQNTGKPDRPMSGPPKPGAKPDVGKASPAKQPGGSPVDKR